MEEKRASERVVTQLDFSLTVNGSVIKGITKNLSADGALLFIPPQAISGLPAVNEPVTLLFGKTGSSVKQKQAHIVRLFDLGPTGTGLAVRFTD